MNKNINIERDITKQLRRVLVFNEMLQDELDEVKVNLSDYSLWRPEQHNRWEQPERFERGRVKRLMLMLRIETIKLEKMMDELNDWRNYKTGELSPGGEK